MVAQVMHTLFQAHCLVHFDRPTLCYLDEMMERVQDAFEQCFTRINVLCADTWKSLEMIQNNIIHPIHAAIVFLNHIYICSEKFKENEEMKNVINNIREHLVVGKEKKEDFRNKELYRLKDSNVFKTEAMLMLKTSS
jgi:hypothetical protein